jgi:hypothetical protein
VFSTPILGPTQALSYSVGTRVRIPVEARDISFLPSNSRGCGVNRQRREVHYSQQFITEVKKQGIYTSISPHAFMVCTGATVLYLITLPDVTACTVMMTSQARWYANWDLCSGGSRKFFARGMGGGACV